MDLKIVNITVNTDRPGELARWWLGVLGGEITGDWGEYVMIRLEDGSGMGFQYVEGTAPGRMHIDFAADDVEKEVARLVEAGATYVAAHEVPEGGLSWTVLADPDGNQFCVCQGH